MRISRRFLIGVAVACFFGGFWELAEGGDVSAESARAIFDFNPDWRFAKEDVEGADSPDFDDSQWEAVGTPHTFNDRDTFDEIITVRGEKSQYAGPVVYRKHFKLPEELRGRKVFLEFERIRQAAVFSVNGTEIASYENGLSPFGLDLTDHVVFGDEDNVLTVRLTNEEIWLRGADSSLAEQLGRLAGRMGSWQQAASVGISATSEDAADVGADINRAYQWAYAKYNPNFGGLVGNVRLHVTGPVYQTLPLRQGLGTIGTYVYPKDIRIAEKAAQVCVESEVKNESGKPQSVRLVCAVVDAQGKVVAKFSGDSEEVADGQSRVLKASGRAENLRWWDVTDPYLYTVRTTLEIEGKAVDARETTTGFRKVEFRGGAGTGGVYLNDRFVYLNGYTQNSSNEWAAIGQAQPDWLQDYTIAALRASNANLVRWTHMAPMKPAAEACDRYGVVQIAPGGDTNADTKGRQWLHRLEAMQDVMIYLRNHPSILFWEAGNGALIAEHMQQMREVKREWDPQGGRAIGARSLNAKTAIPHAEYFSVMMGENPADNRQHPSGTFRGFSENRRDQAPFLEAEDLREEAARRYWDASSPPHFGFQAKKDDEWDLDSEQYCLQAIKRFNDYKSKIVTNADSARAKWSGYVSLNFTDTNSWSRQRGSEVCRVGGKMDAMRLPKQAYFAYRVMQNNEPDIHILGHWTYPEGTKKPVYVVSNCDEVELFLNGESLGVARPRDGWLFEFPDISWQPGKIDAVGRKKGRKVAEHELETVGPPARLKLTPITGPGGFLADASDVALIDVEVVDEAGRRCPTDESRVDFEMTGPATWRGGYNSGKPGSTNRKFLDTECGINRVAIRSGREAGEVVVIARREGLPQASITIEAEPVAVEAGLKDSIPRRLERASP